VGGRVSELDAAICAEPRLAELGGRFWFSLDDGRADVIAKPKPRVVVPRSMGVAVSAQRFVPRRGFEAVARFLRTGRVFTGDVDAEKRTSYARRTRRPELPVVLHAKIFQSSVRSGFRTGRNG
jgi:hypothetical protein